MTLSRYRYKIVEQGLLRAIVAAALGDDVVPALLGLGG